jgi:hypothetical protein
MKASWAGTAVGLAFVGTLALVGLMALAVLFGLA